MGGVSAVSTTSVPLFWLAMAVFAAALVCVIIPATAGRRLEHHGKDTLNRLQQRWPTSFLMVFGLPIALLVVGTFLFTEAGATANARTLTNLEEAYGVTLDLGPLELPREEDDVPTVITDGDTVTEGVVRRLDGLYLVMEPNERGALVEYGRVEQVAGS